MTRLLGHSFHQDGDGCTGQDRPLAAIDTKGIQHEATRMLRAIADGDHEAAARRGGAVALHYGPEGEWFLCQLLADHVRRGATAPRNLPQITLGVAPGDPQALALLSTLAIRHGQLPTTADQRQALEAARLPLQTFMLHMTAGDHTAARRQWQVVFRRTDGVLSLAALGFTAQLVLWASRTLTGRTPAPQNRR